MAVWGCLMARVELRSDLNAVVARVAVPAVNRLAEAVAREARDRAPSAKVWLSRDDDRVRPAHVAAHHQTIPENLRFQLPQQREVPGQQQEEIVRGRFDLARKPRDPDLPEDQKRNCRCVSVTVRGLIARRISTTPATVVGAQVRAQVLARFTRIVECEHGTPQDPAARFLGGALDAVAARVKAQARRT